MDITHAIISIIVFIIINASIFSQLYRYFLKKKKAWQVIILTLIYWSGAVFTENLLPFIGVIMLIYNYHLQSEDDSSYLRRDGTWDYSWISLLKISITTLIFKTFITIINSLYIICLNYFTGFEVKPQEIVMDFYQADFLIKSILFLFIVIFAPFVEEYVFRYFLYEKLFLPKMPMLYAAFFSALIFTIAHYDVGGIPSFFALALFCNYIYEKYGYFGAVTVHFIYNLSSIILLILIRMNYLI